MKPDQQFTLLLIDLLFEDVHLFVIGLELLESSVFRSNNPVIAVFIGRFNLEQLDVKFPELSGLMAAEVCPEQVTAFSASGLSQLLTIQSKAECRVAFFCGLWELAPKRSCQR